MLWDPRGREIGSVQLKTDDVGIDIDRVTLLMLLAEAVGADLRTGVAFDRFDEADGGVEVHLTDGTILTADVVVGADGVHSRVARQLAGGPTSSPTGKVGTSGRTLISGLPPETAARADEQAPWPAGRVTAIGDAVHGTPPTAGMGAGAAVRDAAHLADELLAVDRGDKSLTAAITDFQAGARERGGLVIAASLPTVRQILSTRGTIGSVVLRLSLPTMRAMHRLRTRRRQVIR